MPVQNQQTNTVRCQRVRLRDSKHRRSEAIRYNRGFLTPLSALPGTSRYQGQTLGARLGVPSVRAGSHHFGPHADRGARRSRLIPQQDETARPRITILLRFCGATAARHCVRGGLTAHLAPVKCFTSPGFRQSPALGIADRPRSK